MEKVVTKRSLRDFRQRDNPWKDRGPLERLAAMLLICQTHATHGEAERGFPHVYRIVRK